MDSKRRDTPDYQDKKGHGTHVAGIILHDVCDEVELISCKYYDDNFNVQSRERSNSCFKRAFDIRPDIINYSSGGPGRDDEEFNILRQLSSLNIKIVVSAGNDGLDLSLPDNEYYPAKYKLSNLVPVGSLNYRNKPSTTSNYGLDNMVWEIGDNVRSTLPGGTWGYMSGTSMAAAAYSNRLLKEMCSKDEFKSR